MQLSFFSFFNIPHVNEIIQDLSLSDFISLSIMPSRSINVSEMVEFLHFLWLNNIPLYYNTKISCGHSGCFPILAIIMLL